MIVVGVEEIEDWGGVFVFNVVIGLDLLEVVDEVLESGLSVFIGVVGDLPEGFQVLVADFVGFCCY